VGFWGKAKLGLEPKLYLASVCYQLHYISLYHQFPCGTFGFHFPPETSSPPYSFYVLWGDYNCNEIPNIITDNNNLLGLNSIHNAPIITNNLPII
jgi:hypothetical protein